MSVLSSPHFHSEPEAFAFLESVIWANGTVCPHCGVVNGRIYDLSDVRGSKSAKNPEGAIRHGLKKCGECRKQFTAKVGTVFEHARMPLHKMLQAMHLITSSKKGISAHQLHRTLEVTYKAAWFLSHRIREAMSDGSLSMLGMTGGRVEVDETYIGRKAGEAGIKPARKSGSAHKNRVMALVDRDTGTVRSMVANGITKDEVAQIVRANIAKEAKLTTDESRLYSAVGREYASHDFVTHGRHEYVRGDVSTNTVEGYFSIFKRGMRGVYQHCGEKHLHRYCAEFAFRYSNRVALGVNDRERAVKGLEGIVGKRLTYR